MRPQLFIRRDDFGIRLLGETTNSPVSERTVDQVDELTAAAAAGGSKVEAGAGWTRAMVDALMDRLRENGYEDRALVIERGIASAAGPLSRADVLTVLGRPTDAKLTGFTRAIPPRLSSWWTRACCLPSRCLC